MLRIDCLLMLLDLIVNPPFNQYVVSFAKPASKSLLQDNLHKSCSYTSSVHMGSSAKVKSDCDNCLVLVLDRSDLDYSNSPKVLNFFFVKDFKTLPHLHSIC